MTSPSLPQGARDLIGKLESRDAVIGIIGLGYVGLPLALGYCDRGFTCLGFDVDDKKVTAIKAGQSYIQHIPSDGLAGLVAKGQLDATTDFSRIGEVDAILICVPTPLNKYREPELKYVLATGRAMAPHLRKDQIIVLESTTYPGTTDSELTPLLEEGGLKAGEDFFVAFSPEREDPGNDKSKLDIMPKVVAGDDAVTRAVATALYTPLVSKVVAVSSTRTAEAVKLTENIFRAVNIALVNELKVIFDQMDIDVWEVIDAAATKPFGFMPFYPGPGLGGHCIPIDPFYLTWKAREYGVHTRFIELAGEINNSMPGYVIDRLTEALNDRQGVSLREANILLLGVAYKKNVDDMRESPALRLIDRLLKRGATVDYHDPFFPEIPPTREFGHLAGRRGVDVDPARLATYNAVLICTDHDDVDYANLVKHSRLVIDTRNATSEVTDHRDRIVKA